MEVVDPKKVQDLIGQLRAELVALRLLGVIDPELCSAALTGLVELAEAVRDETEDKDGRLAVALCQRGYRLLPF